MLAPAAQAAAAPPQRVVFTLPGSHAPLTAQPPLAGSLPAEREPQLFRQRVDSRERVDVRLDAAGSPVAVTVVQRLRVTGKGDYLYTIPAPVLAVEPTADSASQPGRRQGAVVWAGFSPGARTLGVRATLDVSAAGPYLPLAVSVRRTGKGVEVTLRNATRVETPAASARGDVAALRRVLAGARRGVFPAQGTGVVVEQPVVSRTTSVEARLSVRGSISVGSRGVDFDVVLGDGAPLTRTISVAGSGRPRVQLEVETEPPRSGLSGAGGPRSLFERADDAFLRAARAHQYDLFLVNPGLAGGTSTAVYRYVLAPAAAPAAAPSGGGGIGALGLVLIVLGCVLAAGAALVAWAHS